MHRLSTIAPFIGAICIAAVACAAPAATPAWQPDVGPPAAAVASASPDITLIRSPSCSCCGGHEEHLMRAGYAVRSELTDSYVTVKDAHRIPLDLRSCHTALIGRYFVEGHVPVAAIDQLLRLAPDIDGIALPGMPAGSPGMGGTAIGPLTIYSIVDGTLAGEFGRFAAPDAP